MNNITKAETANAKWKITTDGKTYKSDFYTFMKDKSFQCTLNTEITYYYVKLPQKVNINFVAAFKNQNGYEYVPIDFNSGSKGATPYEATFGKETTVDASSVLPANMSRGGYQWQAERAVFGKAGDKLAAPPKENVPNSAWVKSGLKLATWNFNLLGQTQANWQSGFAAYNKLKFTPNIIDQDYVYVVYYTVAPPQVELYYEKTSTGYELLEVRSGGNKITGDVTVDKCKRLDWTESVSSTVNTIRNFNGTNMVLTKAYPILCDKKTGTPSIKGYNGATTNAWAGNALPTTGAQPSKGYKAENLVTAYKTAKNNKEYTISYGAGKAPYARVFIYVYEAGPTVTVKSAIKEYNTYHYKWLQSDKTFNIGGKEYPADQKYTIQYPLEVLDSPIVKVADILAQDCISQYDSSSGAYKLSYNSHRWKRNTGKNGWLDRKRPWRD